MSETIPSQEIQKDFFLVLTDESKKKRIKGLLNSGRAVAFLVTDNNEIYIGTSGTHDQLLSEFDDRPTIKEKGTISPLNKAINFIYSDHFTSPMDDAKRKANQPKIKYLINNFLETDFK